MTQFRFSRIEIFQIPIENSEHTVIKDFNLKFEEFMTIMYIPSNRISEMREIRK